MRQNENTIRKFEKGKAGPNYHRVDDLVAAYAESTGVSVFDLWDKAIQRASENGPKPLAVDDSGEPGGERRQPRRESDQDDDVG